MFPFFISPDTRTGIWTGLRIQGLWVRFSLGRPNPSLVSLASTSAFQAEGEGSNPSWWSKCLDSPIGRGDGLKIRALLVQFQF